MSATQKLLPQTRTLLARARRKVAKYVKAAQSLKAKGEKLALSAEQVIAVTIAASALHVLAFGWLTRCGVALPLSAALAYAVARFAGGMRNQLIGIAGIIVLQVVVLGPQNASGVFEHALNVVGTGFGVLSVLENFHHGTAVDTCCRWILHCFVRDPGCAGDGQPAARAQYTRRGLHRLRLGLKQLHGGAVAVAHQVIDRLGEHAHVVGQLNSRDELRITRNNRAVFHAKRDHLQRLWAETTRRMQALRDHPECAREAGRACKVTTARARRDARGADRWLRSSPSSTR